MVRTQRRLDALLLSIILVVVLLASLATCSSENYYSQQCTAQNKTNNSTAINNCPSVGVGVMAWASDNHDAIEALAAIGGLIFSLVLTVSTIFLWKETRNAALAGGRQAEIAYQAIHANERAWLTVEIKDFEDFKFARTGGAEIRITLLIRNIGKTPAINAHSKVWLLPSNKEAITKGKELAATQRCVNVENSLLVLPQDSYERPWGATLHPTEIERGRAGDSLLPVVFVCTTYQTLPDYELHQTVICHSLSLGGPEGSFGGLIKIGQTALRGVLLVRPISGGFAD